MICLPHHFQCNEQLSIAEDNGGEGNSKAEAKKEHHIGFVVVFVVCGVPVWTRGALLAFWDIPGQRNTTALSVCPSFPIFPVLR